MAKKITQEKKNSGLPLWLGTFGDLMSLLLTFFILLLSMATFDAKKLVEAEASIKGALSILDGGIKIEPSRNRITLPADMVNSPEYTDEVRLIEQSIIDFNEKPDVSKGVASIEGDGVNGFMVSLPANMLFDENLNINEDSKLFLYRVSQIANKMPINTQVEIVGKSNLSSSKISLDRASNMALSVARILYNNKVSGSRLSPIGQEDKELPKTREGEIINIRFYAKDKNIGQTKGILG